MIIYIFESLFLDLIRYKPNSIFIELYSTRRRSVVFPKLSIEFYALEGFFGQNILQLLHGGFCVLWPL